MWQPQVTGNVGAGRDAGSVGVGVLVAMLVRGHRCRRAWRGWGVVWGAPGRRGALLAGFIVLIAGKAGGLGRAEPEAGLERLWRGSSEGERAATASGASGAAVSPAAAAEPGGEQGAACPTLALQRAARGSGGLAAAGCGGRGGYGCLGGVCGGLLWVGLCGHPRQEEGAEASGPWEDLLPVSSCCEEPGCGVAWLVLGYVPLLEDDLSLPGRQLCLIVPESP